jgi:hypothetical protein
VLEKLLESALNPAVDPDTITEARLVIKCVGAVLCKHVALAPDRCATLFKVLSFPNSPLKLSLIQGTSRRLWCGYFWHDDPRTPGYRPGAQLCTMSCLVMSCNGDAGFPAHLPGPDAGPDPALCSLAAPGSAAGAEADDGRPSAGVQVGGRGRGCQVSGCTLCHSHPYCCNTSRVKVK